MYSTIIFGTEIIENNSNSSFIGRFIVIILLFPYGSVIIVYTGESL